MSVQAIISTKVKLEEDNQYQSLYHYQWCPIALFRNQCSSSNTNSFVDHNSVIAWDCHNKPLQPNITLMSPFSYPPTINAEIVEFAPTPSMFSLSSASLTHFIPSIDSYKTSDELKSNEYIVQKRYSCKLCADTYETIDDNEFREHINIHSDRGAPFNCQICSKKFKFRSLWRNHIIAHMVVRDRKLREAVSISKSSNSKSNIRFNCDQCQYNCNERSKLDRHKRMHSGIKPFKCPDCKYESYDKTKIRRHYVTHTREKPFSCEQCRSRFTQSGSLKGHLKKVHCIENVELKCAYCKAFSTSNFGQLRIHINQMHESASFAYAIAK